MIRPGQRSFFLPLVDLEAGGRGSVCGGPVLDLTQAPLSTVRKIRKLNGFRDLEGHREPGQDEAVGKR
jgi:hypothetical protein